MKTRLAIASVIAVWTASPALAANCRDTSSVKSSTASESANRTAGGHVGLHLKNATAPLPPGGDKSQLNKTAFKDWATFKTAFDLWASGSIPDKDATVGPKTCGGAGGSQKDCIKAAALGITEAWTCSAANPTTGLCTTWVKVQGTLYVGFWYANSKDTKGKWIVNTAYPSTNSECN